MECRIHSDTTPMHGEQKRTEQYGGIIFSDSTHTGAVMKRYRSAVSTQPAVLVRLIKYDNECQKDMEEES